MGVDLLRTSISTLLSTYSERTYPTFSMMQSILARVGQLLTGTSTGTGLALAIDTAGDPQIVVACNIEGAAGAITICAKVRGMGTGYSMKLEGGGPTISYVDDTITLGTGSFTIGVDTDLNAATDALVWFALV